MGGSGSVHVRRAQPADARHIAGLVLASAETFLPALFGPGIRRAVEEMAAGRGTLFSHEHAWIAEQEGAVRGMLLGYTGALKAAEDPFTGLALLRLLGLGLVRRLRSLLRMQSTIGRIEARDYYISNVAVYAESRGAGIGSRLIERAREEAGQAGSRALVLDVETDNPDAQRLYERLGFQTVLETPAVLLNGRTFAFRRMEAPLEAGSS